MTTGAELDCLHCGSRFTAKDVPFGSGNRYRLRRLLKMGGMAYVFAAVDTSLSRYVALKSPILPHDVFEAARVRERFRTEIQALQAIYHPNINRVIDHGTWDEWLYYAMPYLGGGTLGERLRAADQPAMREAIEWILAVAQAMAHAHVVGVVHRDLKPSNLMFDGQGRLLVTDFGLALFIDDPDRTRITRHGDQVGSLPYMSPEQVRGMPERHGPPTDIYSLGVILYEVITGRRPFTGESYDLQTAILNGKPPKPRSLRPEIDPALQSICLKSMSRLIDDRYETMQDFADALAGYLGRPARPAGAAMLVKGGPDSSNVFLSGRHRLKMARVTEGEFVMGSELDESERPPHRIRIGSPFLLGVCPVTQALYSAIAGSPPLSLFKGRDLNPVDTVSWFDAVRFCNLLSASDGLKPYYEIRADGRIHEHGGTGYRLPTEAEWEYACRGGCASSYSYGDDAEQLGDYAWYQQNSESSTHEVGQLAPNGLGLHDMHGNVWEWCWDWYAPYPSRSAAGLSSVPDPRGPAEGSERVLRGGSWNADIHQLRSAARNSYDPKEPLWYFGFRLARSLEA
ncbi:MAG: bifunctional serine/threonine-protein kinase/formylglycine-generating enzyme family protein [Isosphaerales bacterium]